jgi:hypothetical protein
MQARRRETADGHHGCDRVPVGRHRQGDRQSGSPRLPDGQRTEAAQLGVVVEWISKQMTYRILVKSENARQPRGFIWVIIHEEKPEQPVKSSDRRFTSMEAAYVDGAAALKHYLAPRM